MTNSNGGGWGGGSAKVTKSDDIFFNNPSFTDNKIDCLGEGGSASMTCYFLKYSHIPLKKPWRAAGAKTFLPKSK